MHEGLLNQGTVISVRGSIVDIRFDRHLPSIHTVLHADEGRIIVEVQDTGGPLKAPVGCGILSRMFDVFGQVIDRLPPPADIQWRSVHRVSWASGITPWRRKSGARSPNTPSSRTLLPCSAWSSCRQRTATWWDGRAGWSGF